MGLIEDYELEVFTPPCHPGAETWSAVAHFAADISPALPYLNATLRGAVYNQAAQALAWKKGGRNIVFHAHKIAAGNLEDRDEAEKVIRGLVKLVNQTWERRAEIEPSTVTRQRPTPMAVLKLLPGTNCRECGQPTCFTFALKVVSGERQPEDCPTLLQPRYAEQLAALQACVGDMPAIGRRP
jgi:ArsR family metal-binding transcriptional regulator